MATNKTVTVTTIPTRTGDTVASYNIYSSVDGLLDNMTPAEAAAGHVVSLSDGSSHNITVKTVWTTAGESTTNVSNIVVVDLSTTSLSLTNLTYDSVTVPTTTAQVYGIAFNTDGTIMYQLSNTGSLIRQATLSTAYDITSAGTYSSTALSGPTGSVAGLYFKPDGLSFFFLDQGTKKIIKNTMSVAWDTTSINGNQSSTLTLANFSSGMHMNDAGTKVYTSRGAATTEVREYTLSTPWDLTTDTLTATVDTVSSLGGATRDIFLSTDGTKILIGDNENVGEFTLSTPYDLSTLVTTAVNVKSLITQDADPRAFVVKPDYSKFYLSGIATGGDLYQYSL